MKYKLTLPKDFNVWWKKGFPRTIIVEDGKHECDYDVVESSLPKETIEEAYECIECVYKKYHEETFGIDITLDLVNEWLDKPLGIKSSYIKKHGLKLEPINNG